jgi:hypothetical protein
MGQNAYPLTQASLTFVIASIEILRDSAEVISLAAPMVQDVGTVRAAT